MARVCTAVGERIWRVERADWRAAGRVENVVGGAVVGGGVEGVGGGGDFGLGGCVGRQPRRRAERADIEGGGGWFGVWCLVKAAA